MKEKDVCKCKEFSGVIDYHCSACSKPFPEFFKSFRENYKFLFKDDSKKEMRNIKITGNN